MPVAEPAPVNRAHVKEAQNLLPFSFLVAVNDVTYLHFIYSRFKKTLSPEEKQKVFKPRPQGNLRCLNPSFAGKQSR